MEVGVDIVELERIEQIFARYGEAFLKRFLSPAEIDYCCSKKDPVPSIAGRFAAKEALSKVIGTGITGRVRWKSFEVLNNGNGKPVVDVFGEELERFAGQLRVSISHDRHSAVAVAFLDSLHGGSPEH